MRLHNRIIKAEFWSDTDVKAWSRDKRLFFIGIFQLSDDSGCLEDDNDLIKGLLFPYQADADITLATVGAWIDELVAENKIVRYIGKGRPCLYVFNFHKHQTLKSPAPPSVPLPEWITWQPFASNPRTGKYIVSEERLTTFLQAPYTSLTHPLQIPYVGLTKFFQPEPEIEPEPEPEPEREPEPAKSGAFAPSVSLARNRKERLAELRQNGDLLDELARGFVRGKGQDPNDVGTTTIHGWANYLIDLHNIGCSAEDAELCSGYIRTIPYWRDKDPPIKILAERYAEWKRLGKPAKYIDNKDGQNGTDSGSIRKLSCDYTGEDGQPLTVEQFNERHAAV